MKSLKVKSDVKLYNPFSDPTPRCLLELKMLRMREAIRNKTNWHEKILNSEIVAKWKIEALAGGLTDDAFQYVIDNTKYLASVYDKNGIQEGPVDATFIADNLIDDKIVTDFKKCVKVLDQDVPEKEKDYHPGSDNLVIDLVHPSLYCYVENRSLLIKEHSITEEFRPELKVNEPEPKRKKVYDDWIDTAKPISKYRWLPAEVYCNGMGQVEFNSYINNLHPTEHKELYKILEKILEKFIPMFSRCLTDVANWKGSIIDMSNYQFYDAENADFDYDEEEGYNYKKYQEWEETRQQMPISIPKFKDPESNLHFIDLTNKELQVIVKLANIELTPEKPRYNGGTWHIEGIDEERIVASGIYYYEMDNISESKLSFRQRVKEPPYEQNDNVGVRKIFGLEHDGPLNQYLGDVVAKEGRCVVFPNIFQHQVQPFELVDKTKKGTRKILVFFLIDPTVSVISTENVQPQQEQWKVENDTEERKTMTRLEALEFREKLMFERKFARDEYQKAFYEREFSLCEH